jgi:hypothetical protein
MKLGKIPNVLNIGPEQADNVHGRHKKDLIVLHETVSPDYKGWSDVTQTSSFLDNLDYGIHGIVDLEGHTAWAYGYGQAIFYHAISHGTRGDGLVNTRGIGIELVSRVMMDKPDNLSRWRAWWGRSEQIEATAKLVATVARFHNIPLVINDSSGRGITTHWQVSHRWGVPHGHWDCWPKHLDGYFPLMRIVERAKYYQSQGY